MLHMTSAVCWVGGLVWALCELAGEQNISQINICSSYIVCNPPPLLRGHGSILVSFLHSILASSVHSMLFELTGMIVDLMI